MAINDDVPSRIDLKAEEDARAWAATAMLKRPWRSEFFAAIGEALRATSGEGSRLLELGSGPGFLAEHLLDVFPGISYVALDFSPAMNALARSRLEAHLSRVEFVERSFLEPDWGLGIGLVNSVVTMQAVHELRHKRRAAELHRQVRSVLRPGGLYLVCDHYLGHDGMSDAELYMTIEEQALALRSGGFEEVAPLLVRGGLVLHRAVNG